MKRSRHTGVALAFAASVLLLAAGVADDAVGAWVGSVGGLSGHLVASRRVRQGHHALVRAAAPQELFMQGAEMLNPQNDQALRDKGLAMMKEAAQEGFADGQNTMGLIYLTGIPGIQRDSIEAHRWLQMADANGHVDATFNLALMYLHGDGVVTDKRYAAGLFKKAAEAGHEDAAINIATMLSKGDGIMQDARLGGQWLMKIVKNKKGEDGWEELKKKIDAGTLDEESKKKMEEMMEDLREANAKNPFLKMEDEQDQQPIRI